LRPPIAWQEASLAGAARLAGRPASENKCENVCEVACEAAREAACAIAREKTRVHGLVARSQVETRGIFAPDSRVPH